MASMEGRCDRSAATLVYLDVEAGPKPVCCLLGFGEIMKDDIGTRARKAFRHGQT